MNKYIETNVLCWGLLCALSLTACSGDAGLSQDDGTTEEKNAFWDGNSNLKAWNVIAGSSINLEANKNTLAGRVTFDKNDKKVLSRAGIVYDASNPDGSPVDLSEDNEGLCITYQSDFDVEVRLDEGDIGNSSVDADLPFASFTTKKDGKESNCVTWKEFKKKGSSSGDDSYATKVRSVQIIFVGESGSSGEFDIQRLAPYVRWEMWWSKKDGDRVKTGFDEGDEGTSGKWSLFGDSTKAHIEFDDGEFEPTDGGYEGNVVFDASSSNPDVGLQFLVAGKSTENGTDVIHSADVSTKWNGICIEYESQIDIEMQLVPENPSEDNILKLTFAKNDDVNDMTVSTLDESKRASHMEHRCYQFADVPNSDNVLKKLTTVRLKFVKENNSGTSFVLRRVSYLMPENFAVKGVGEFKDVKPTESSDYKSGKSFLWNGAVDGDHVDLGIAHATSGGIWTNNPEFDDLFDYNFPYDVVTDANGNAIPSLVSKHHEFTMYVKTDGASGLDSIASIGFNTVSSKLEPADISAWGGFCIHYSTYNYIRIAIITDYDANKYWYADVDYSDDKVWTKVSWDAFKNIDKESDEKIEDVLGKVTTVQLQFLTDGENIIDRFGSYDQCGE
ncbi:MAG: hypothetical protein J6U20_07445 [Fibrobacter sp.]|nr:hypothetical protein [Fibrobacter sp.]